MVDVNSMISLIVKWTQNVAGCQRKRALSLVVLPRVNKVN